jgi:predicted RNA methylase
LRHAGVGAGDVFVDLGCGLGRVVFAASRLGADRAVGVEIDAPLVAQCKQSAQRGGYPAEAVDFVCAPAQTYAHDDTTVLFMFHPFGAGTVREVVAGLDAALDARPRKLTVIYFNPVFDEVLGESRHLKRIEHWPERHATRFEGARYAVSFWRV